MKKYLVEFIGMFFFVLTVGLTVVTPLGGAGAFAPLVIGSVLMILVYAGGHISGGHYNPAVTLAVLIRGKCTTSDAIAYWIVQGIGAALAAVTVCYLEGDVVMKAVKAMDPHVSHVLLAEFLFTFLLCYVVLNVATAKGTAGNSNYGLAIGFTVVVGAYSAGWISGGVFNPAIALGITMLGLSTWAHIWIYLVANFAGAVVAALVFKFVNPPEN